MKKETFELDGKTYAVIIPTRDIIGKARSIYSRVLGQAMKDGVPFRDALFMHMREQGLWDDEKEEEHKALLKVLNEGELKLAQGGIKLSEARQIAVNMMRARRELSVLLFQQRRLDAFTIEGMAENAQFDALVSMCVIDNTTGKPVFSSPEDYKLRQGEDVAVNGATVYAKIHYNYDEDAVMALPENKFMVKWGFMNDDLHLVDEDGRLINEDGHFVDDLGRLIDEDGHLVDNQGVVVDEDGNYAVEQQPFLDDDGNPLE
jgi:hypothetical protein